MAVLLNTQRHRNRSMSARAAAPLAARTEWHTDACRVATIPTVGTNLTVHPTTGFGFKPYHQRPKETLL